MNYYKFKRGMLNKLIKKAINKAGSERKLKSITKISLGNIHHYKKEEFNTSQDNLNKLLNLLNISIKDIEKDIKIILPSNWGQIKGAKEAYKLKLKQGTFKDNLRKMNKASSRYKKLWHKNMKNNNPTKYYTQQYNYFKKIGGYKYLTKKKEKVRNILERDIADFLYSKRINYEYEPLLIFNEKAYFPDFKINNLIVEATMWKGTSKIDRLKEKQTIFESKGLKFLLIVSKDVEKYYLNQGLNITTNMKIIAPNSKDETF